MQRKVKPERDPPSSGFGLALQMTVTVRAGQAKPGATSLFSLRHVGGRVFPRSLKWNNQDSNQSPFGMEES